MNTVSGRLLSQQLASPQFSDPAEVVSWFGALQAQDPRSIRWAVAMRTRRPSFKAFEKSFNEGRIIRAHLLRCTWQIVPAEDYHWMRQVIYDKGLSVLNGWAAAGGHRLNQSDKTRILSLIEKVLGERGCLTEQEITDYLRANGVPEERLFYSFHLRMAELEVLICSGPLADKSTYMLVSQRIGEATPFDKDDALGRLARKYFRSHGPATLEDFVWWSGLSGRDCKRGITVCGNALRTIKQGGRVYYLHEESRTKGFRSGNVLLLPSYDEYLIGYKSRDVVLHPDHAHHAHDKKGIFHHVVALDGEIVGNWHPSAKDGGISVFKDGLTLPEDGVKKSLEQYYATSGCRSPLGQGLG